MAVTADVKGTAILRNKVADYLNTEPGGESPAYHLMNVFETIDENPNAQVVEKHYTSDKAATKLTSAMRRSSPSQATSISITMSASLSVILRRNSRSA